MAGPVEVLQSGNNEIIYVNFSGAGPEQVEKIVRLASPVIRTRPEASVLTLTEVTAMPVSKLSTRHLEEFMTGNKPYVRAAAVFGLSSVARAILGTLSLFTGRRLNTFSSKKEALSWLASQ